MGGLSRSGENSPFLQPFLPWDHPSLLLSSTSFIPQEVYYPSAMVSQDLSQSCISYCLVIYFLHFTTSALIIGFTSSASLIRWAALPLHLAYAWAILTACLGTTQPTFWTALLGGSIVGWTLQFIEVVLLSRWSFDAPGISPRISEDQTVKRDNSTTRELVGFQRDTLWNRLCFG